MKYKKKLFLVSIIINCHNGDTFLKKAVISIIKQTYNKWEIIFFNNNSTDKSEEIIKSFKDKRIKYYESKKYLTLYKARNEAIKKTKGKYICFLDCDDWWDQNKIQLQIDKLEAENLNIIYSNYYLYSEKNKYKKLFYSTSLPSGYITKQLLKKYVIAISSTTIRANFLKKMLFNSKYEIIGDFDFFIKSSIYNKILCIQKPLLYMRTHKKNFSLTRRDLHIYELNNWLNDNCKLLQKNGISLRHQKLYLYKLKLKNFINIFLK